MRLVHTIPRRPSAWDRLVTLQCGMAGRDRPAPDRGALAVDSSRTAEQRQIRLWRGMSDEEKARAVRDLSRAVQELSLAGIRRRHPGASDRECFLRLAELKLGRALVLRVYSDARAVLSP